MSARERFYSRIERLTDKQVEDLEAIVAIIFPEQPQQNDADEVDAVCGILHQYANPELIPHEKEAWAEAAAENERQFWEDYHNENA